MRIKAWGKFLFIQFSICIFSQSLFAQNKVSIKGIITNASPQSVTLSFITRGFTYDYLNIGSQEAIIKGNSFSLETEIDQPEIAYLYVEFDSLWFYQPIYLSSGYQLWIDCQLQNNELVIQTKGKGANDNQRLLIERSANLSALSQRKDSLPFMTYQGIKELYTKDSLLLEQYIQKNHPSEAFIDLWRENLQYAVLANYFSIAEDRKFYIRDAYYRNIKSWDSIKNNLLEKHVLSNDDALKKGIPFYYSFLKKFMLRTKERLWTEGSSNLKKFIKDWYGDDYEKEVLNFKADSENALKQKIIERYFSGATKEYMYAVLFDEALYNANPTNIQEIYTKFTREHPNSKYQQLFGASMKDLFAKLNNGLTSNMIFVAGGDTIHALKQVLEIFKGKTVLLDMWGTWCGPCREEMKKHGEAIKAHFKNKGLEYLYVANGDIGNEKKWKELIAFFKLEGYHILAKQSLTDNIMSEIKGTGYPTYAIIKPDGSVELSKAGYPMKRDVLISQIEGILR